MPHPAETVTPPPLAWRVFVAIGLPLLAVLALAPAAFEAWTGAVSWLPPRPVLAAILAVSLAAHAGEALYARARARAAGLSARAVGGWTRQTLAFGAPSLVGLLRALRGGP